MEERIEQLEDENQQLREKVSRDADILDIEDYTSDGFSRRSFLKALGLGAGGLALASPVTSFFSVGDNLGGGSGGSQTLAEVLSNGNDINSHDIVDGGTTVWDTSASRIPASQIQQGDGSGLDADSVDTQEPPFGAPSGAIAVWNGSISNIPSGWVLCDGNNGTPNLQDRFVVGAGSSYAVDGTGGSQTHTLTTSEMPRLRRRHRRNHLVEPKYLF